MDTLRVGICIPVYYREEKVRRSLESLLSTRTRYDDRRLNVIIRVADNGSTDSLRTYLYDRDLVKRAEARGFDYAVALGGKNRGKPQAVNNLVKHILFSYPLSYVVSYDSDIVIDDPDWLNKAIDVFENWTDESPLGALCPNQKEYCCHILGEPLRRYTVKGHELVSPAHNSGIAGGVLITTSVMWEYFGGYRAHRLFASDDGDLTAECDRRDIIMAVTKDISVIHPHADGEGYMDWKRRASQDRLQPEEQQGYVFE